MGRWPLLAIVLCATCTQAQDDIIVFDSALVVERVRRAGREPVHTDPVETDIGVGGWHAPAEGDAIAPGTDGPTWRPVTVDAEGWLPTGFGGYAYAEVRSAATRVMVLEAAGHSMVFVNGEPRAGDVYGNGSMRLPVLLNGGANAFLFQTGRGRLRARLVPLEAPLVFCGTDPTLPDLVSGERVDAWGAVPVINATTDTQRDLRVRAKLQGGDTIETPLPPLPPLSTTKVGFRIRGGSARGNDRELRLSLLSAESEVAHTERHVLRVRRPEQTRKVTFVSETDGSVQYYAINPAVPSGDGMPALVLSCHGAGVEAIGQADAYSAQRWAHIVCPTNRRPYGFDWEDWGRLDALETLAHAKATLWHDPARVYLTGHSMGGHGAWHLGVTYPDLFAAVGPSAGWISFSSYASRGGERGERLPMQDLLARAASPSDTLALKRNLIRSGVYILHGEADDNVPVDQARTMRTELEPIHKDLRYHEQPGASHWWDDSDEPGASCVDWWPMWDFFAAHALPPKDAVREVEFHTASPGISAQCDWVTIVAQHVPMAPSAITIRCDPHLRRLVGGTENVARLALDVRSLAKGPLQVEIDGDRVPDIPFPSGGVLLLDHTLGTWRVVNEFPVGDKQPARYGPFREAFSRRAVLVYGTQGTPEENAWAAAKARFDAEQFWYRGNASWDVVSDTDFDARAYEGRNVILYGNRDTNRAWRKVLDSPPVEVRSGRVTVGERTLMAEDLACLFVAPRTGDNDGLVGVVGGTGLVGMKLTDLQTYFVPGAAYPDWMIQDTRTLAEGVDAVVGAGYFSIDWQPDSGASAWRE